VSTLVPKPLLVALPTALLFADPHPPLTPDPARSPLRHRPTSNFLKSLLSMVLAPPFSTKQIIATHIFLGVVCTMLHLLMFCVNIKIILESWRAIDSQGTKPNRGRPRLADGCRRSVYRSPIHCPISRLSIGRTGMRTSRGHTFFDPPCAEPAASQNDRHIFI